MGQSASDIKPTATGSRLHSVYFLRVEAQLAAPCTCCSDLPVVKQPTLIYPFIPVNYNFNPPPNWAPTIMPMANLQIGVNVKVPGPPVVAMNVAVPAPAVSVAVAPPAVNMQVGVTGTSMEMGMVGPSATVGVGVGGVRVHGGAVGVHGGTVGVGVSGGVGVGVGGGVSVSASSGGMMGGGVGMNARFGP